MSAADGRVEGPAFPWLVKLLATGLVAAMLLGALRVQEGLRLAQWTLTGAALLVLAVLLVLWCLFWMVRSRTGIDRTHIRQSWMWTKEVALADVAHARLVGVPGLSWLVAPRLVVRARGRGLLVFHAADPQVLAELSRLCLGLPLRLHGKG